MEISNVLVDLSRSRISAIVGLERLDICHFKSQHDDRRTERAQLFHHVQSHNRTFILQRGAILARMNDLCQGVSYPKGTHGRVVREGVLYRHLTDMVNLAYTLSGLASELTELYVKSLTTTRTSIKDRTDESAAAYLLLDLNVHNGLYAAHTPELDSVRTANWNEVLDRNNSKSGSLPPKRPAAMVFPAAHRAHTRGYSSVSDTETSDSVP
jgi:hypothetical protein